MNPTAKAWVYFFSARFLPSTHFSEIHIDRIKLVYAIMTGLRIDVGRIIRSSIRYSCRLTTIGGLSHGTFITELCHTYDVPTHDTDVMSAQKRPITKYMILTYGYSIVEVVEPSSRERQRIEENIDFDIDVDDVMVTGKPSAFLEMGGQHMLHRIWTLQVLVLLMQLAPVLHIP